MNKNDISDAMDFVDEDMIRHTEIMRKKWTQQKKESGLKRKWRSFGAAAAACLVLFFILIVLVAVSIVRRANDGQEEGGTSVAEGMTAEESGQSEPEEMTASHSETDGSEPSEEFVAIETLLAAGDGAMDMEMAQVLEKVSLGDDTGLYEVVASAGSEVLTESIGTEVCRVEAQSESTGTEVSVVYYRVAGHSDLQYLIRRQTVTEISAGSNAAGTEGSAEVGAAGTEGSAEVGAAGTESSAESNAAGTEGSAESNADGIETFSLMKFLCLDSEEYAYSEVLRLVYQIQSAEDIAEILVKPSKADNTDEGKRLQEQIGERTVTDADEIEAIYEILCSLTCYGSDRWDLIELGGRDIDADPAVNYSSSAVWLGRYLTITTDYGNEIDGLKYTAYSDMFYEFSGIAYSTLTQEQAQRVCEILEIDADGTEAGGD
ncbi:MAG: hypothetical protein LUC90_06285 [Lachnospiraceae bacterium]|nr:hypothetical protein [Lachnospiraceae bacterium]